MYTKRLKVELKGNNFENFSNNENDKTFSLLIQNWSSKGYFLINVIISLSKSVVVDYKLKPEEIPHVLEM